MHQIGNDMKRRVIAEDRVIWLKSGPQGRRNVFVIGGGSKTIFSRKYFGIALTYQKDTILYIGISVISNIHTHMSLF